MDNQMKKRYGLFTAICMVVGIVIGSGVFFKAQDVLNYTGGNMLLGILAWIIGGIVMIICAFNFANFGTKYVKVNGVVDYAEAIVGKKYAYMIGWFLTTIYYPAMTAVLAWVSARYTLVLFGSSDITGGLCMALGGFYLCLAYAINVLSPKIAGKFQVSATVVKLIPLAIIVVVGTIVGFINGNTVDAFSSSFNIEGGSFDSVFAGIGAAAFAYEGWIIATSINSELKEPKKNLPRALVIGTAIIMVIYITYFIGLSGGAPIEVLRLEGATAAFKSLFGSVGSVILNAFIVVSCLGTLNGLMLANTRSLYSLSVRDSGPKPKMFSQIDPQTNMPVNSSALTLLFCGAWFFYFYGANLTNPIFGVFSFDSSELPIITIYALYIPIFIMFIVKEGKKSVFKNIVMPILAVCASLFMIFVAIYAHGIVKFREAKVAGEFAFPVLFYLIVFAVIMIIGALLYKRKGKK
ncbi:MAG: amino acid permease [Clostridia bacterium]|nr:amino acid permease [Clostridia bacterium]